MPDKHTPEDLLQDEDVREDSYRALLLPIWFKIGLGFLTYFHVKELLGIIQMKASFQAMQSLGGPEYIITLGVYIFYTIMSAATIAACFMFHRQMKYAVRFGLPVLIVTLLLAIVAVAGYAAGDAGMNWRLIFNVLNVAVLILAIVHVFRIRKEWAVAVTVL